ncbi:30S ribosomal protein S4 [archaeon]|jgi:small subunit ribosomal protein S4|nr:30S ribosomal protein S4 [archaeon]MBT4373076.1 30S ribosomal protein S4 [archaeon]MBT4531421.1 30S ribosomal protein S4 [archaeon]MBT7001401.1 30S ribosomal protein S4 [archaeon]MBT7282113.1 30S ribosomal protein S4 [archaeon]
MKRKHKTYSRPRRPFDKARIEEEAEIKKDFGLKNKKEIWKAEAKIKSMREKAKKLISAEEKDKKLLFDQLNKIGLNVNSIADVLGLDRRDYLGRRLQTVILNKNLVTTIKSARQMITHKKVMVDEKIVNKPSFIVPVELEKKITIKAVKKKVKKVEEKKEEVVKETEEAKDE